MSSLHEIEYAKQMLAVAENLRISSDYAVSKGYQEAANRYIASGLYYGAHHLSRLMLKKRGENPDAWVIGVHTKVINELSAKFVDTGIFSDESLQRLKRLKTKRVKADYYLGRVFQLEEMRRIFELYRDFIRELIAK